MRFVCDKCQAKYSIPDERVANKVVTLSCQKCGNAITVRGPTTDDQSSNDERHETTRIASLSDLARIREAAQANANVAAKRPAPAPPRQNEWMLLINGQQDGPFSEEGVFAKIQANQINARTYVWREGMNDWQRMSTQPELSQFLSQQAPEKKVLEAASLVDPQIETGESTPPALEGRHKKLATTELFDESSPVFRTGEIPFESMRGGKEPPPQGSTRAVIDASGLQQGKRHTGLVVSVVVAVIALVVVVAWVLFGGDAPSDPPKAEPEAKFSDNLTDEERKRIRDGLMGKNEMTVRLEAPRLISKTQTDLEAATKVVETAQRSVLSCFERSQKRGAQVAGRFEVELTIAPTGGVTAAEVKSAKHKDTEFAECATGVLKALKFAHLGNDSVVVEYAFILSTAH